MSDLPPDFEASPDAFPDDPPPPPPEKPRESPVPPPRVEPLPAKVTVGVVVFTYDGSMRSEIWLWSLRAFRSLWQHPRVAEAIPAKMEGYGAERVRNKALADALDAGVDFLLMVDNDTVPDWHSADADQTPFLPSALDFMLDHDGPCVVGAPYCAGPPNERVLVSRFCGTENEHPDGAARGVILENFSRQEAATRTGMELVSSLPTGCLLIDTRVAKVLCPPWFSYEYADARWTEFASTEDTVFTRNLFYLGVPLYCAWQSWCAHIKVKHVGRPRTYPQDAVPRNVRKAWERMAKGGG